MATAEEGETKKQINKMTAKISDKDKKDMIEKIEVLKDIAKKADSPVGLIQVPAMIGDFHSCWMASYTFKNLRIPEFKCVEFSHSVDDIHGVKITLTKEDLWQSGDSIIHYTKKDLFEFPYLVPR